MATVIIDKKDDQTINKVFTDDPTINVIGTTNQENPAVIDTIVDEKLIKDISDLVFTSEDLDESADDADSDSEE